MNHDSILLKIFFNKENNIIGGKVARLRRKFPNILSYLNKRYPDSFSLKETLIRMKYHIDVHPKCPVCGNFTKFYGFKNLMFTNHCSNKCTQLDSETKIKFKQTCLEKYGVDAPMKSSKIKEKSKQVCLEKYGVENISQFFETKEKYKQTCLEKYGVDNPFKLEKTKINSHSKEAKEKQRKTCLEKYGVENSFQSEEVRQKYKENYKRKYGVENPFQNEIIKEKIKQTCLEKYGVDRAIKNSLISNKVINTRIKNNTWTTSKPEEKLYLYIKEKFPSVIRQYKDKERYPYFCDFYIPELDLFLELNGTWTHGNHPYDMNSKEDNSILNIWKEKSKEHPMYLAAIKTWVVSDVNKRNKAKENHLNFKEVWNLDEGKEFINNLS